MISADEIYICFVVWITKLPYLGYMWNAFKYRCILFVSCRRGMFYCWFRTFGKFSFVGFWICSSPVYSTSCTLGLSSVSLCFSLCVDMSQWRILLPLVKSGLCCVSKSCSSFLRWNIVLYKIVNADIPFDKKGWWEICLFFLFWICMNSENCPFWKSELSKGFFYMR